MNSILFTLNNKQSTNHGKKRILLKKKRLYKYFLLENTIGIELAEPSIIKNEPIESELTPTNPMSFGTSE